LKDASRIRPIAICLFRRGNQILLAQYYDAVKHEEFYRPLGGAIEFGEYARDTVIREVHEEIGADVRDLQFLFVVENLFTFEGKPWHEIVFVFDGVLADESLYERAVIHGQDTADEFDAVWRLLRELENDSRPLYPDGLLERLCAM
jgi:8-oxo-dGTP pyrophosphatase MutT (NUDIX family)